MHTVIAYITRVAPESLVLAAYFVAAFALAGLMLGASYLLGGRDH